MERSEEHFKETLYGHTGLSQVPIETLADLTGISESRLYHLRDKGSEVVPKWREVERLMKALPLSFTQELMGKVGVTASRATEPNGCPFAWNAAATKHVASLGKKFDDGKIDHREEAELRRELPALIEAASNLLAALNGQASSKVVPVRFAGKVNTADTPAAE